MKFKDLAKIISNKQALCIKYEGKPKPRKLDWWDPDAEEDLIDMNDALHKFSECDVERIESESFTYSELYSKLVVYLKDEINMKELTFKDGQIYKFNSDNSHWFTKGNKYPVVKGNTGLVILDDEGLEWYDYEFNNYYYLPDDEELELVLVDNELKEEF